MNYADSIKGVQAGLLNIVRSDIKGFQTALVNYAGSFKGVQLGLLNISDSAKGTPIGLLSIVRKGYMHLDVFGTELTHVNLSFRTGVSYFHNIITLGAEVDNNNPLWHVGYGLGSEFSLGKKKHGFTGIEITTSYITRGKDFVEDLNILSVFNWHLGVRIKKHFAFFAGPSIKLYSSDYIDPNTGRIGMDIAWKPQKRWVHNGTAHDLWFGIRGGLRF